MGKTKKVKFTAETVDPVPTIRKHRHGNRKSHSRGKSHSQYRNNLVITASTSTRKVDLNTRQAEVKQIKETQTGMGNVERYKHGIEDMEYFLDLDPDDNNPWTDELMLLPLKTRFEWSLMFSNDLLMHRKIKDKRILNELEFPSEDDDALPDLVSNDSLTAQQRSDMNALHAEVDRIMRLENVTEAWHEYYDEDYEDGYNVGGEDWHEDGYDEWTR